ncbi:MAG: hypothetical protein J6F30_04915 [Cellulosilyticum sp.]|nr:hypothetical protein [Cellulosilyticum sp.]
MKREGKVILAFIGSLWIAMPLYILLHEGGHALIAAFYGARIIEFNILEGYVVADGGAFNEFTLALFYAIGLVLPVVAFSIYLMLYRSSNGSVFYQILSAFFSGIILFSIGVWMAIPIGYLLNRANPNDDVVQFIEVLKLNPLVVSIGASVLMSIYAWMIWKKKVFQNVLEVLKR